MRVPKSPLEGELTALRRATSEDAELLVAWHADPEVSRFWDGETFTREEMLERLARDDVDPYIVMEDAEPVGYLQVWFDTRDSSVGGLDMFLIPEARGRGLGPDSARAIARSLLATGLVRGLTVDPYLSNDRAVAAWKKVGFVPVEHRSRDEDHAEAWLLMAFQPIDALSDGE